MSILTEGSFAIDILTAVIFFKYPIDAIYSIHFLFSQSYFSVKYLPLKCYNPYEMNMYCLDRNDTGLLKIR